MMTILVFYFRKVCVGNATTRLIGTAENNNNPISLNQIAVTSVSSGKPTDTSIASSAHQYRSGAFILFLFRFVLFNFRLFLLLFFPEVTRWCIGEHAHLHGTILCYTCTHTHTHTSVAASVDPTPRDK